MFVWLYKFFRKPIPYYAKYSFGLILWKPIRKFLNVVIIPNIPFSGLRAMLYRTLGFKIGKRVFIGMKCYMDDVDPKLTIIGDDVTISYAVKFAVHGKDQSHTPIVIEDGSYIGMGALLVSGKNGISIGRKAIIGAGSVVTHSIPEGGVAVGNPARVIRSEK